MPSASKVLPRLLGRFFLDCCKANHPTQHEDTGPSKPTRKDGRSDNAAEKRREGAISAFARTTPALLISTPGSVIEATNGTPAKAQMRW